MISTGGDDEKERKEECNFQITFKNVQKVQKDKKDLLKNAGVFPLMFQQGILNIIMGEINLQQLWTALRA